MGGFSILYNRKRALVALAHSFVFLGLATWQMHSARPAPGYWGGTPATTGTHALCAIYLIVSSILAWLFAISRGTVERAYFSLCTASATTGLLRTVLGDARFPAALPARVFLLTSAVLVGMFIVRLHSEQISAS